MKGCLEDADLVGWLVSVFVFWKYFLIYLVKCFLRLVNLGSIYGSILKVFLVVFWKHLE